MRTNSFYWKSANTGNANNLKLFLHQLRSRTGNKTLVLILDNASSHHAKRINAFLKKYPEIKLYFLPPYSPEYNPTEQVWKWIKPLVHAARTITEGVEELIQRFRKIMRGWINNTLASPPKVGLGEWKSIL